MSLSTEEQEAVCETLSGVWQKFSGALLSFLLMLSGVVVGCGMLLDKMLCNCYCLVLLSGYVLLYGLLSLVFAHLPDALVWCGSMALL